MELNKIYQGDSLSVLKTFPSESIDCIVTSPPYYSLRDYGVEGQIGQEKTPQEYISNLMNIMNECKRVLKKTGSCWVNIGDSYSGSGGAGGDYNKGGWKEGQPRYKPPKSNLPPKSLIGIPERFVIAMTDSGWIRRNSIIWFKSNCMPSSAKDRFTCDYEPFYFFTKSPKYYFETQYEPNTTTGAWSTNNKKGSPYQKNNPRLNPKTNYDGRIKRCVWNIPTKPFPEAHFAVFPEKLIETPIKACSPPNGTILDPFMGAGTTALVAKKLGRNFVGIELNESYIAIANKRIGIRITDFQSAG